jgi:trigger factor
VADLAGKEADFTIDVKEVRQRSSISIDDELGQAVGLENLAELRQELRQRLQRDYDAASRLRLKRSLLDKLAEGHDFPVPPGMVDLEFDNIWTQYQAQRVAPPAAASAAGLPASAEGAADDNPASAEGVADVLPTTPEGGAGALPITAEEPDADALPTTAGEAGDDDGEREQSEAAARAEYRRIAERRVRLGLLLADVGRKNNITVTPDEVNQAITREARRHPGHERQILDFYRQNPGTIDALRAPIFEDKVIDFIVELAKIGERKVTSQELLGEPESGDDTSQS